MARSPAESVEKLVELPPCPRCHQTDQVQNLEAAYTKGRVHLQLPFIPKKTTRTWVWITVAAFFLICALLQFFLFVQTGGPAGFGGWPIGLQVLEIAIAVVLLITLCALSFFAFGRVINAERETTWQYPANSDVAQRLQAYYHCNRDHLVFDANQQQVLSDTELEQVFIGGQERV